MHAVGDGPLGEQRGPAAADMLEDLGRAHDVQKGVVLAGEGEGRRVLGRRAGPDGEGGPAEPGERAGDRRRDPAGDRDLLEGPADVRAERADRLPVVRVRLESRSSRSSRDGPPATTRRKASVVTRSLAAAEPSIREARPAGLPCRRRRDCVGSTHRNPSDVAASMHLLLVPQVPTFGRRVCGTAGGLPQAPHGALFLRVARSENSLPLSFAGNSHVACENAAAQLKRGLASAAIDPSLWKRSSWPI